MREFKFNYRDFNGKLLPIIDIWVKGKDWTLVQVFVDSGASISIFNANICKAIGFNLEDGELTYLTVGDGGEIPVYLHEMSVKIEDREFKATIGFSEKLGIGFNILGRRSFFENFMFCFDDKKKVLRVIESK